MRSGSHGPTTSQKPQKRMKTLNWLTWRLRWRSLAPTSCGQGVTTAASETHHFGELHQVAYQVSRVLFWCCGPSLEPTTAEKSHQNRLLPASAERAGREGSVFVGLAPRRARNTNKRPGAADSQRRLTEPTRETLCIFGIEPIRELQISAVKFCPVHYMFNYEDFSNENISY